MVNIMTALATASQAIKLAQDLRGIDKVINEAERATASSLIMQKSPQFMCENHPDSLS